MDLFDLLSFLGVRAIHINRRSRAFHGDEETLDKTSSSEQFTQLLAMPYGDGKNDAKFVAESHISTLQVRISFRDILTGKLANKSETYPKPPFFETCNGYSLH